ncbi:MAG: aldo/keto reductase [Chthonomonadales bacterium]|nr:aldo/keto reductase [Chthonomonadales bacterium]
MRMRTLGRTGLHVSELSLGGLFVSSVGGPFEQAREATLRAIALGVNYVDTAPTYMNGEEVFGAILSEVDQPVIISTKLGGRPQPFDPRNRDHLYRSFEESLRLLRRDAVDILMIHEPDRPGQYDWWTDWTKPDGPAIEVLADLKQRGLIRFTGLGGTTAYELARLIRTGAFDVVLTAFNYSLLWREAAIEVLPAAVEQGMGIVIGSPLQQGALARRYDDEVNHGAPWLSSPRRAQYQALYAYLDDIGMSLAEAGIRFVLSNPNVTCTLMGARSAQEVEENIAAAEAGPLPPEVLQRLDEIAAMVPFRPFEEPFGLPFGRAYRGPGPA